MKKIFYTLIGIIGISMTLSAQTPNIAQTTLKYNCTSGKFGVYIKFNQNGPVSIGASLISIILPASFNNQPLNISPINGGGWTDASLSYDEGGKDFHGISTTGQGNMAYGTAGSELLLFEFALAANCASDIRLWTQGTDADQTTDGTDYVSNIFTPANNNYILTTNYSPIGVLSVTANGNPSTCNASNGSINLSIQNNLCPLTYLWSNGATTQNLSGLSAGTYTVTVTGNPTCTASTSYTINSISDLSLNCSKTDINIPGGNNGAASVTASGGTNPYTYLWSNSATTMTITGLTAGTYSVTVTDANNCQKICTTTVNQPSCNLSALISGTNVSCYGMSNGNVTISPSGNTSPLTYLWNNGATTQNLTNVAVGSYTVTVTENSNCTVSKTYAVSQPSDLTLNCTKTDISIVGVNDGTASVAVTGGTNTYFYLWSNGATSSSISGLAPNLYSVTVTDSNGCTDVCSSAVVSPCIVITQPDALTINVIGTDASCNNSNTGAANLTVSGGVSPYTYLWSNGATTEDLNNIPAGSYSITVTDANGCKLVGSTTISQPTSLTSSIIASNVGCNSSASGAANLTVSGGTAPYSYLWSNGITTEDLSNVLAGTYNVTITDNKSCVQINSVTITEPNTLNVVVTATDALCNGSNSGNINLTANGGTMPYSFAWSNGATTQNANNLVANYYSVTVTDTNGCTKIAAATINEPTAITVSVVSTNVSCNGGADGAVDLTVSGGTTPYSYQWNNGATTKDLNNITANSYSITVTDKNNCTKVSTLNITQPDGLTFTFSQQNVKCFGQSDGTVTLIGIGGKPPYQFSLDDGLTYPNTNGIFNNLGAGAYKPAIKDANGCTTKCQ